MIRGDNRYTGVGPENFREHPASLRSEVGVDVVQEQQGRVAEGSAGKLQPGPVRYRQGFAAASERGLLALRHLRHAAGELNACQDLACSAARQVWVAVADSPGNGAALGEGSLGGIACQTASFRTGGR